MIAWLGFLFAIVALLLISQWNLGIAMFVGAIILGIFTMPEQFSSRFWTAITTPSTLLLACNVALIPIIGGALKASGQMDNLVDNLRIGKKAFLLISPALVGMLPMPGGALLSAPLIDKGGTNISKGKRASLNVWFRHILYLVYPISPTLMVSAQVAQLDVYHALPYLFIAFIFSLILGYFFFLRNISNKMDYSSDFSLKRLLLPLTALLVAPLLDVLIKTIFNLPIKEIATFIGIAISLLFTLIIGRIGSSSLGTIILKAKPWNFGIMMLGIMVFLNIFANSGILQLIGDINISPELLFVIGFLLGFGTGRVVTPAGIIFPIFITKFGEISPSTFTLMYFSFFLGYIMTPVHPCVSLSLESFKVGLKEYFKTITPPTLIAFIISFLVFFAINP